MREDVEAGRYRGLYRLNYEFAQSSLHCRNGLGPRFLVDDELGNHRIIICRDFPALVDVGINPDAGAAGRNVSGDFAGAGCEIIFVILGVNSALNCDAPVLDILLAKLDGLVISAGGIPINIGGSILGGIGVSGAPSGKTDEKCAQAGLDAVRDDIEMEGS